MQPMLPGETTLTRMLCGANSEASPRAMPISPIFAADKCVRPLPLAEKANAQRKERIRAAWSYIGKPKNQKPYSAEEVSKIKAKIVSAWKEYIDSDGPPSASEKASHAELAKALWDVGQVASIILELNRRQMPRRFRATVAPLNALINGKSPLLGRRALRSQRLTPAEP